MDVNLVVMIKILLRLMFHKLNKKNKLNKTFLMEKNILKIKKV